VITDPAQPSEPPARTRIRFPVAVLCDHAFTVLPASAFGRSFVVSVQGTALWPSSGVVMSERWINVTAADADLLDEQVHPHNGSYGPYEHENETPLTVLGGVSSFQTQPTPPRTRRPRAHSVRSSFDAAAPI